MKKIITLILINLIFFGCATSKYKTIGVTHKKFTYYSSKKDKKNLQKGKVVWMVTSYYGKKFHGRKTASGEKYDMFAYTCAHKTLPFGTKLKVINTDNNKSVIVRVNDRGPFVKGRDLDLSYAAAKKIGLTAYGYKKLKVIILGK